MKNRDGKTCTVLESYLFLLFYCAKLLNGSHIFIIIKTKKGIVF